MAIVRDPIGKARVVSTELKAARLYQELDVELALNDAVDPKWERDAVQAQKILRSRFPDADLEHPDNAQGNVIGGWGPSHSPGAKKGYDPKPKPEPAEPKPAEPKPADPKRPGAARPKARRGRRGGRLLGGRARRRFAQTGVPGAGESLSRAVMQTLGLMLFLSILYLLLTDAQRKRPGGSAVDQAAGGVSRAVRLLVAPVDPLARKPKFDVGGGDLAPSTGHPRTPVQRRPGTTVGRKSLRDSAARR